MAKRIIALLLVSLFFLSLAMATETLGQPTELIVVCVNAGYCSASAVCNLNVANPINNTLVVDGQNMTNNINYHNYTFTPNSTGLYTMTGICIDGVDYQDIDDSFYVTINGSDVPVFIYITLLVVVFFLFIFIIWFNVKFDKKRRDKLYKKIVTDYFKFKDTGEGNLGHVIFYALAYGLMSFFIMYYYLAILLLIYVLLEIVLYYNVTGMAQLLSYTFSIYIWGFVVVFVVMTFQLYELVMRMLKDSTKLMLGVGDVFG